MVEKLEEADFDTALASPCSLTVTNPISVQGRFTGPARRSTKGSWSEEEDKVLVAAVKKFNGRNWKKIAECIPHKTDVQCLHRWQKVLDPNLVKGPWKKEEDDLIVELVGKQGNKRWSEIAKYLPGRIGKQCRERWHNHLNPNIKRTAWTKEEESILIKTHAIFGNKWAEIAKSLQGRTENSIKNHWNCSMRKKLDSYLPCDLVGRMNQESSMHTSLDLALGSPSLKAAQFVESNSDERNLKFLRKEDTFGALFSSELCNTYGNLQNSSERTHVASNTVNLHSAKLSVPLTLSLSTPSILALDDTRDSYTCATVNPVSYSNLVSHCKASYPIYCSPESILRSRLKNAATSFKHTPSIIRKKSKKSSQSSNQTSNDVFPKKTIA